MGQKTAWFPVPRPKGQAGVVFRRGNTVACSPVRTLGRMYRDVDFRKTLIEEMLETYAPFPERDLVLKPRVQTAAGGEGPAAAGGSSRTMWVSLALQVTPKGKRLPTKCQDPSSTQNSDRVYILSPNSETVETFPRKQMQGLDAENYRALLMESLKSEMTGRLNSVTMTSLSELSNGFFTTPVKISVENNLIQKFTW